MPSLLPESSWLLTLQLNLKVVPKASTVLEGYRFNIIHANHVNMTKFPDQ